MKITESGPINYNEYNLTKNDYLINIIKALLVIVLVSYTFFHSVLLFILLIPCAVLYPFSQNVKLAKKRKEKLIIEFKEMINILASYLDAGYSTENAFVATRKDIKKLFKEKTYIEKELDIICKNISMNKAIEIPLRDFAFRSGTDDIVDFSEVFILAKRSGGELHRIINETIKTIRDKIQVYMDIQAKTSQKRFEQSIMNLIPFIIILYLKVTSKGFLDPMYNTLIGKVIMLVLLALYVLAFKLSEKILDIEV